MGRVLYGNNTRLVGDGEEQSVGRRMTVTWWVENSSPARERESVCVICGFTVSVEFPPPLNGFSGSELPKSTTRFN